MRFHFLLLCLGFACVGLIGASPLSESIAKRGGGYVSDMEGIKYNYSHPLARTLFPLEASGSGWTYDKSDPNHGPYGWWKVDPKYSACKNIENSRQSPIDLIPSQVRFIGPNNGGLQKIEAKWGAVTGVVSNDGHAIGFVADRSLYGGYTMTGGWNSEEWRLLQFHIHIGSEHTFKGAQFPLEIHCVSEAVKDGNRLAVVGITFKETEQDNLAIEPLIVAAEKAKLQSKYTLTNFNLGALFPIKKAPQNPFSIYSNDGTNNVVSVRNTVDNEGNTLVLNGVFAFGQGDPSPAFHQIFEWIDDNRIRWVSYNRCLDVTGNLIDNANVVINTCGSSKANQRWFRNNGMIQSMNGNKCMYAGFDGQIRILTCNANDRSQKFFITPNWSASNYFQYSGSLTTPDCKENVDWRVFAAHSEIGGSQLDRLIKAQGFSDNYRPTQPLNGRTVHQTMFE